MRKPIVFGNWKMNKTVAEATAFFDAVSGKLHDHVEFGIATPYTALAKSVLAAKGVHVAAQNVHYETSGAFTGEVSIEMLQELNVNWVILGHSERRAYYNETDETVNKKVKAVLAAGIKPIVCVGETLDQFEAGKTKEVVQNSVAKSLEGLNAQEMSGIVIAYEPVWAIGTGKNATQEIAQATCKLVREQVAAMVGQEAADAVRIQYGGSVKPHNIAAYMSEPDIDGALIGGAALKADSFIEIAEAIK
jgi:triosephosphate isomerase